MRTRARFTVRSAAIVVAIVVSAFTWTACHNDPTRPTETPQLDQARVATSRYQHLANAVADGYVDAHIVMQGMGVHYLNSARVNGKFDPERPQLLVYVPEADSMRLVALEYAVPLDSSATAPSGFAGGDDVWDRNTTFGLWTLHAWIWYDNPGGVFTPTNSRVHLPNLSAAGNERWAKGIELTR